MPSVSKAQHGLMALCSTLKGRKKARGDCPPMDVANEFHEADKRKALAKALRGKKHG